MLQAVIAPLVRYARWLHTAWPAGTVEPLPEIRPDGATNVPGLYVAGDLAGIPLLKFAADTGARVVRTIAADPDFRAKRRKKEAGVRDLVILGAGVAGMSAALEARSLGLDFQVFEAKRRFQTIADFPKGKPIYTYPRRMEPAGSLRLSATVKEELLEELEEQTRDLPVAEGRVKSVRRRGDLLEAEVDGAGTVRALTVLVTIGRSGDFRKLGVPGEQMQKVHNRLHDPADFRDRRVLVVGGGDSALEAAVALARAGARVTVSYRRAEFSRPKPENVEGLRERAGKSDPEPGTIHLELSSRVREIHGDRVVLERAAGERIEIPNDFVFAMIGREPPLAFFRRAGVRIAGEWTWRKSLGLAAFLLFVLWLYHWKAPYAIPFGWKLPGWLHPDPARLWNLLDRAGGVLAAASRNPKTLLGTLRISASSHGFYYTLAYSIVVVVFGIRRIRYRRTPYVTLQTTTLMAIQVVPLFLLPEIVLPWLGHNGAFDHGVLKTLADGLFPAVSYGQGREYWRAFGLILAWPLMVWNWFTGEPLWWWLGIGFAQTFVAIPLLVYFYGKGAYCGWICSCGALAETLGDRHRHKMPHGPRWNRLDLVGQGVLAAAVLLLILRVLGWSLGDGSWPARAFAALHTGIPLLNYNWLVDLMMAGVIGYGAYFWFSGRVWCRFACPLAALMHIYARLGRFRILADKKKCISCNLCTTHCHQGIDVMNFANKGLPMADPECVRCSACVQVCPTAVLSFGRVARDGRVIRMDRLEASPVRIREENASG